MKIAALIIFAFTVIAEARMRKDKRSKNSASCDGICDQQEYKPKGCSAASAADKMIATPLRCKCTAKSVKGWFYDKYSDIDHFNVVEWSQRDGTCTFIMPKAK